MQGLITKLLFALVALALALSVSALAAAPKAEPLRNADAMETEAEGMKAKRSEAKGGVRQIQRRANGPTGGPQDGTALWWNDPKIQKALTLTEEQRKTINGYLKTYRAKVPRPAQLDTFHEMLVQGSWKQALSESHKLAERAEMSVRMRGRLKIDILSVLTKEQHETLVDRYPRLIYKPWTRAMRGAGQR